MSRQNSQSNSREILIADASVKDLSVLLDGIKPSVDVWLLKTGEDAISQIIKAMAVPGLKTLHLLAHGAPGEISLGGRTLTATDFRSRFDGAAERDLDIAFWSCNTGSGDLGQSFVKAVAETTGARVAAADGLVGSAEKGGSWNFNDVVAPFSLAAQHDFSGVLAKVTNTAANLAKGLGWKAGDDLVIRNESGDHTATMAQLNKIVKTNGGPNSLAAATVTDLIVNAIDLNLLDDITRAKVDVLAAKTIKGTAEDIATAISANTINTAANIKVKVATGTAAAADLNMIDTNTKVVVDAKAVKMITGTAADITRAIRVATIDTASNVKVTVEDEASVAKLNQIAKFTTGAISAIVTDGQVSSLIKLAGANNDYSMTITDEVVSARDILAIDAVTKVNIDATNVSEFFGSATDIAQVLISETIDHLTVGVTATLEAGSANAADLIIIAESGIVPVDATAMTTISGKVADIQTAIATLEDTAFSNNYAVNLTESGNLGVLTTLGGNHTLTVGYASKLAVTVDLGTSEFTTIHLGGTGNHVITAAENVRETFFLDADQNGGSRINGLTVGDKVNIDGAGLIEALTGNSQAAKAVDSAGEWGLNAGVLTYFNSVDDRAEAITLTGVTSVILLEGDVFQIGW
ncbi:MAG: DUF4347 domain-containing protein [Methylococcales bacterium]|nr:DUF4347 domain-containing protein [Methylococcales bacterium]